MPPRLFVEAPLSPGAMVDLPPNAARHVQVLRLQPGDPLSLFDGRAGQWLAVVHEIGRKTVSAQVQAFEDREAELPVAVTLACGMPANERMDTLVEKATELGAALVRPLVTARSVLRVAGERAERKAQHWQAIAQAACEQCGRNRVPTVAPPQPLAAWLATPLPAGHAGLVLSLDAAAPPLAHWLRDARGAHEGLVLLSGPEGGLAPHELEDAQHTGYLAVSLGPRVLRADTAPLAALAVIAALAR